MRSTGLKIKSLQIVENDIFQKDISVTFYDQNDLPDKPYTSVIIGPNGTGKSNLLKFIILLFSGLFESKFTRRRNSKIKGKYLLTFAINDDEFQYGNWEFKKDSSIVGVTGDQKVFFKKNDREIGREEIELPLQIIAHSVTLTDKFPQTIKDFNIYSYLGIRTSPNSARTTSFIRNTVDLLYAALDKKDMINKITEALSFLDFDRYLYISYTPRYKRHIFNHELTEVKFLDFFNHFWKFMKREKDNPPWSLIHFKKIKEEQSKIKKLVKLCNRISSEFEYYENSKSQYFGFDIYGGEYSNEDLKLMKELHALDLISYPGLSFMKRGQFFDIENSSAGEYHFISGFISLLAKIEQNSIVLIDEPENSLHPNWQMQYASFLKKIFKDYSSCHFILATHSHLLVSDLEKNSSNIIGLTKEKKGVKAESIPSNTYGWSADEILLKIFNTGSSRNYYLTDQISQIMELISSEEPDKRKLESIKKKVADLRQVDLSGLSSEDPLKDVIEKLFQKF